MKAAEHFLEEDQTLGGDAVDGGSSRFPGGWVIDTDLHGSPRVLNQKTPQVQSENRRFSEATEDPETVTLLKISEDFVVRQEATRDSGRVWAQIGLTS